MSNLCVNYISSSMLFIPKVCQLHQSAVACYCYSHCNEYEISAVFIIAVTII